MSKKPTSFASKGQFDVLSADEPENGEEEEVTQKPGSEAIDTPSKPETSTPTLSRSKSAKRKLSAAAAKLGFKSNMTPQKETSSATSGASPLEPKVDDTATKANGSMVNGSAVSTAEPVIVEKPLPSPIPTTALAGDSLKPVPDGPRPTSPKPIGSSFTPPVLPTSQRSPRTSFNASSEPGQIPSSSQFSPSLPKSLPLPSSNGLPANRKRRAPEDFQPSGHGTGDASSPNKSAVKFEDGIAPGEGKEGEKTIKERKNQNVIERTVWTFIMIGGFITLLCLGHPYMILLVLLCQTLVYKEVTALFDLRDEGKKALDDNDLWSKTLNWYWFVVTNYFLYGESIIYYFKHIVFVDAYFIPFARNHRFISFMLYMVGFMGFVGNLQRQYLRQQFALFCWVHMTLLLIVVSSHFIVNNILEGHIWFFVPASLVICNDVMAYVCGKLFGRTPLIKLSPKKTVEGFVGAFICTLIFGLAWGTFFMRFPYMICPARDLGTNVFSNVTCKLNPVFVWRDYEFTGLARNILETVLGHQPPKIPYALFQLHVLVMATFASLVAPFGGFFASGFKRAFNIKDFGHSIPGHGGMTDRMDCQFMMGMFSYVYYSSLIRIQNVSVGSIMQSVVTSLTPEEQLELLKDLRLFLKGQGVKV